ncbi:hypothetical protein LZP97_26360 (plasmid) [Rhodococcus sp. DMF-1]|uniref:hypothetical protein n=1 Tax=Rhodococcus sp. DMF-1 TaxID=2907624 RepID=UPI001F480D81|nr:hypothetical protein [Rhodococcus sp. DMF-1]UIR39709.1 hypothetical protein LZP97_26360 [Rhodococcus sp. DMF-1]
MSRRQRPRRRYTLVDDLTREAAIEAVLARMEAGDSFTAATRAAAAQLDVAETTVRGWVTRSGRRPAAPNAMSPPSKPSWRRRRN